MPDEQWSAGYDAGVKARQRDVASITDAAIEKAIEFGEQKERARIVAALQNKAERPLNSSYAIVAHDIEEGEL